MEQITVNDLFDTYKIVIPAIQRDYVQGRLNRKKSNEIKGKGFINYILNADKSMNLSIDLIYVYKGKDVDLNQYNPIDGQQRLTSIWLMLLFFYSKSKNIKIPKYFKDFSYETRVTSKRFINKIVDRYISNNYNSCGIINGKSIMNENWFLNSWYQDPTIKGIINVYNYLGNYFDENISDASDIDDKISEILKKILNIKLNLIEQNNNTIELVDAYIKMNDRGKQLSNFDNLKADIIDFARENNYSHYSDFEIGINNDWNDLFINNCSNEDQKKDFEELFFTFLNLIFLIEEIKTKDYSVKALKDYKLYKIEEYKEEFDEIKKYLSDDFMQKLCCFFRNINSKNFNSVVKLNFPKWASRQSQIKDFEFVSKCTDKYDSFNLYYIILFYCVYLYYSEQNSIDAADWFRIICNIIEDEDISGANRLKPIILNIENLFKKLNMLIISQHYNFSSLTDVYKSEYDKYYITKVKKIITTDDIKDEEEKLFYSGYINFLFDYNYATKEYDIQNVNRADYNNRIKIINGIFNDNGFSNSQILKKYFKYLIYKNDLDNEVFLNCTKYCIENIDVQTNNNNPFDNNDRRKMFKNMLKEDYFKEFLECLIKGYNYNQNNHNLSCFIGLSENDEFYKYYISDEFSSNDNLKWKMEDNSIIRIANRTTNDRKIYLDYEINKRIIELSDFCNCPIKTIPNDNKYIYNEQYNRTCSYPIIVLNHNNEISMCNDNKISIGEVLKTKEIIIGYKNIKNTLMKTARISNDEKYIIINNKIKIDIIRITNDVVYIKTNCIIDNDSFIKSLMHELSLQNAMIEIKEI